MPDETEALTNDKRSHAVCVGCGHEEWMHGVEGCLESDGKDFCECPEFEGEHSISQPSGPEVETFINPYQVQVDPSSPGCSHCGEGKLWSVVYVPDDIAESTSYDDEDHADHIAQTLNTAWAKGQMASATLATLRKVEAERDALKGALIWAFENSDIEESIPEMIVLGRDYISPLEPLDWDKALARSESAGVGSPQP